MPAPNFLVQASHQTSKLVLGTAVFVLGACGFLLSVVFVPLEPLIRSNIALGVSGAAMVLGAGYMARRVRCPRCNMRWMWHALASMPAGTNYAHWILTLERCPGCGLTAGEPLVEVETDAAKPQAIPTFQAPNVRLERPFTRLLVKISLGLLACGFFGGLVLPKAVAGGLLVIGFVAVAATCVVVLVESPKPVRSSQNGSRSEGA